MKQLLAVSILIVVAAYYQASFADSISDSFSDGDTLTADHMNNIKNAVNDNDTRITANANDIGANTANISSNTDAISSITSQVVLKDANGVQVGRVIGMSAIHRPVILTEQGYRSEINIFKGMVDSGRDIGITIVYESSNCTGPAFRSGQGLATIGSVFIGVSGWLDASYLVGLVFYTPYDAQVQAININSRLQENGGMATCYQEPSPIPSFGTPALPNDPNVTGIQNTAYPIYMRIE